MNHEEVDERGEAKVPEYKVLVAALHEGIDDLGRVLLPVRNQTPKAETDGQSYGVELLNDLSNVVSRLQELAREIRL